MSFRLPGRSGSGEQVHGMEGVEGNRGQVLADAELRFKQLQSHIVSRRGGEYSAEESWNGWIKCQDLFNGSAQNVEAGETVEGPEEGAGLSGDAVSRPISETDLVFAKTKKRTFFPAFKAPGTGHVDRVKV